MGSCFKFRNRKNTYYFNDQYLGPNNGGKYHSTVTWAPAGQQGNGRVHHNEADESLDREVEQVVPASVADDIIHNNHQNELHESLHELGSHHEEHEIYHENNDQHHEPNHMHDNEGNHVDSDNESVGYTRAPHTDDDAMEIADQIAAFDSDDDDDVVDLSEDECK